MDTFRTPGGSGGHTMQQSYMINLEQAQDHNHGQMAPSNDPTHPNWNQAHVQQQLQQQNQMQMQQHQQQQHLQQQQQQQQHMQQQQQLRQPQHMQQQQHQQKLCLQMQQQQQQENTLQQGQHMHGITNQQFNPMLSSPLRNMMYNNAYGPPQPLIPPSEMGNNIALGMAMNKMYEGLMSAFALHTNETNKKFCAISKDISEIKELNNQRNERLLKTMEVVNELKKNKAS